MAWLSPLNLVYASDTSNMNWFTERPIYIGIYVPPSNNFPRHFHNMGIRIEVNSTNFYLLPFAKF